MSSRKRYSKVVNKQDRAIARRVALRIGLKSGKRLLRPHRHNPSVQFVALVGPEHTAEDDAILRRLAYKFCPLSYQSNLNK